MKAIDLFAGWGGFTTGAIAAGLDVVWAGNHWQTAVNVHQANHPSTAHACQDLRQADWLSLPAYDVLLASPSCVGHSSAGVPNRDRFGVHKKHDSDRATAWAVVDCADATEPGLVIVENVPAFREWRLYPVWRAALEALGYQLQEHVLVASRHGHTPQRRERLFVVASKAKMAPLALPTHEEPAFGPCIDWDGPDWRSFDQSSVWLRPILEKARLQLGERGLVQYVSRGGRVPITEPIRTITTKDQWAVIDGNRYRRLSMREYARGMGIAEDYAWPDTLSRVDIVRGLGNAVPPGLAKAVVSAALEAA